MKFFDRLEIATTKRSKENISCFHTTTTDFGRMDVPYWTDMVEGQDIEFNCRTFFDAGCMVVPTRGRIFMNLRAFFVPNRILCDGTNFDWNKWRTNLTSNSHPYVSESDLINQYRSGSPLNDEEKKDVRRLFSQMALPDRTFNSTTAGLVFSNPERLNPFALYAYNRIWWDFYRDSNLIDDSQFFNYVKKLSFGAQSVSWFRPRYCCYGKDYFTTAKLNPQEGNVFVGPSIVSKDTNFQSGPNPNDSLNSSGNIKDNTGGNNTTSIQWLRAANAMQRMLERYNIAGGRVMARFLSRFGQAPNAIRLDQSEYLGGSQYIMSIGGITSPLQAGSAGTPINPFIDSDVSMAGQRVGRGVIDGNCKTIRYHAQENGIFMVIATLVPEVGYYQGLHKMWQRGVNNDRESYLCPEFDALGFEPIFNKEVAMCNLEEDSTNSALWGFSRRYGSYCYHNNIVSGDLVLKETRTGMEAFHLLRDFRGSNDVIYAPALNANFTMIVPAARKQFDRIFQVVGTSNEYDHFEGFHQCEVSTVLPKSPNVMPSLEEDEHSAGKHIQIDNGGTRF